MMENSLAIYCALFLQVLGVLQGLASEPIVDTTIGQIRGQYLLYDDQLLEVYKGIPYAEPPVDTLRFKLPRPANKREEGYNATSYGASCMQFQISEPFLGFLENKDISEDCLTLNVFKSMNASEDSPPVSIMVFIHGGGFTTGQGQFYNPRDMVTKGGVMAVTINYRLGVFGFLCTEDENAPGNLGIWDQIMAIQWVKDNAAAFGGDPERITIFGESAGAWSVSILVLSPRSRGLFQRAISQSGVYPDTLIPSQPLDNAKTMGTLVNCDAGESTSELVECLQGVPADSILSAVYTTPLFVLAFHPIVDGDLLPEKPSKIFDIGEIDYMMGYCEMEGYVMNFGTDLIENNTVNTGVSEELFKQTLNSYTYFIPLDNPAGHENAFEILEFAYTYWEDIENSQERLIRMFKFMGDAIFVVPTMEMAQRHQKADGNGATYLYQFAYKTSNPNVLEYSDLYAPQWNDKATHGDDLNFLFPSILIDNFTEADNIVLETMITYWTNFARTGNPNEPNKNNILEWDVLGDEWHWIKINQSLSTGDYSDLDPEVMNLYLEVIPSITQAAESESCTEEPLKNGLSLTLKESEIVIWVLLALVIVFFLSFLIFCICFIVRCKGASSQYSLKEKPI